jgi:hypothetical protein
LIEPEVKKQNVKREPNNFLDEERKKIMSGGMTGPKQLDFNLV